MTDHLSRRLFMQGGTAAALGYFFTANAYSAERAADKPNGKIRFAGIGVGGKGSSDISQAGQCGEVVALCDIDEGHLNGKTKEFPHAKKYFDFRKMLDEVGNEIDAVTVSTPDHTHAPASVMAMRMKKHVYTQKPLTHSVFEARLMRETARKYGVATQMGNQGSAENGLRRAVEIVQAGLLGKVTQVHVWTNRPIWPQGADAILRVPAANAAAMAALFKKDPGELPYPAPPSHVHWDLFLGPAKERPYASIYHPFSWRGWWDFGTGALGDMACHTANMAFRALRLGHPLTVQSEKVENLNPETYPTQAHVIWTYPARGEMPELTFHWYEGQSGGRKMLPGDDLLRKVLKPGERLADSGSILVGDQGILFSPNDYGAQFRLLPEEKFRDVQTGKPEKLPLKLVGDSDLAMKKEWAEAIRSGKPEVAYSNFDYAGMLTEAVLLGNVAIRLPGQKLNWDGPNLTITNHKDANQFIKPPYRKGWQLADAGA